MAWTSVPPQQRVELARQPVRKRSEHAQPILGKTEQGIKKKDLVVCVRASCSPRTYHSVSEKKDSETCGHLSKVTQRVGGLRH